MARPQAGNWQQRPPGCFQNSLLSIHLLVVVALVSVCVGRTVAQEATGQSPEGSSSGSQSEVIKPPRPPSDGKPRAPRIVEDLAARVIDRRPIPSEDRIDPPEEVKAYCLALTTAHATSSEAFANSARRDLTYAHLFEEPEKYRGEVVHYQGRLKRVRQFDAP